MNQLHVPLNLSSKAWNAPLVTAEAEALMREAPDELAQAHLLASHRKESGEWLHMAPMSAIGLRMDREVLRVAVGLRLVIALCRPTNVISAALKWTIAQFARP